MDAISDPQNVRLNTVSTVDAAANVLRQLILDGELEPGARLREAEFAERLGIARHSFRAATQILIAEGMLRREPHRGVQVTVLTAGDILDTFRLRAALEIEAVRLAIAAGRVPDGARQAVDDLSSVPDGAPWRDVVEPDMRFHRAVIDAAESPRIARAYDGVQAEIELCMVQLRPHYERPVAGRRRAHRAARGDRGRRPGPRRGALPQPPHRGGPEPEQRPRIRRGRERRGGNTVSEASLIAADPRPRGPRLPRAAHRPGRPRARGRR